MRHDLPKEKVTLTVYKGDKERMATLYPRLGVSWITRRLWRQHLREVGVLPALSAEDLVFEEEASPSGDKP